MYLHPPLCVDAIEMERSIAEPYTKQRAFLTTNSLCPFKSMAHPTRVDLCLPRGLVKGVAHGDRK